MDREIKTWLFDVLSSIEEIDHFFAQGERVFENYKNDIKTKSDLPKLKSEISILLK